MDGGALFLLLALVVTLAYPSGAEPLWLFAFDEPRWIGIAAALVVVCAYWVWVIVSCRWFAAAGAPMRRLGRWRPLNHVLAFAAHCLLVFVFHLPYVVDISWSASLGPLIALLPFLAMSAVNGFHARRFDGFHFRLFLAFSGIPLVVLLSLLELVAQIEWLRRATFVYPFTLWIGALGVLMLLVAGAPGLLRWLFRARPLQPGELRGRLEDLCRRAGFRCRDLLVVDSSLAIAGTAFIVGGLGRLRYVFFTDLLVKSLSTEELECVLAHEIGHARKQHLMAFLSFAGTWIVVTSILVQALTVVWPREDVVTLVVVPAALVVGVVLFGFLSRRFETEADLFGAKLCGSHVRFMYMLGKLAAMNGLPMSATSLRHFSPAERIDLLAVCHANKIFQVSLERAGEAVRRWCLYSFLMCLPYIVMLVIHQARFAGDEESKYRAILQAEEGRVLLAAKDYAAAEAKLATAAPNVEQGRYFLYLAKAQTMLGKTEESRKSLELAAKAGLAHPEDRLMYADLVR